MPRRRPTRKRFINPLALQKTKKSCPFCTDSDKKIDYKNAVLLNQFISGQAKIKKRRRTGVCATHQRELARAIKRARHMALLPAAAIHNYFNIKEKQAEKVRG